MFGNLLKNRQQPAKRFEYTPRYYKPDENKLGVSKGEELGEGADRFRSAFKQKSVTTTQSKLLSFFVSRYMLSLFGVIIVFLVVMYKYMPAFLKWLENR